MNFPRMRTWVLKGILPLFAAAVLLAVQAPGARADDPALDLSKYRGKVVYLDFWASWCGPCKLSFPFMKSLSYRYLDRDLAVVTVNLDHSKGAAERFLKKMGATLPVVFDSKGKIARAYKVADMPTSFLIDRNGKIRFTHKGFHTDQEEDYLAQVDQLVREQ
ncbi:TlpA disulfide reductase family protein [Kordiimonas marina]|uniref:TlpA disulfide reductase family protein n=1 Tax=Kordiimonas marina TaxID=2872312 RepID=UPI001FF22EC3|nr:TlpA disulfide reductase family protein [Kordiimonas marina]MCJ9430089.1 TlpA family protein disulfide reductase [Kordiimonas marina]